jgi:hypothetical protein
MHALVSACSSLAARAPLFPRAGRSWKCVCVRMYEHIDYTTNYTTLQTTLLIPNHTRHTLPYIHCQCSSCVCSPFTSQCHIEGDIAVVDVYVQFDVPVFLICA